MLSVNQDVQIYPNSSSQERKFACHWEGCSKTFMRKTDVTRHLRIHLNDRPFKCNWPGCGKAFMQRSAVKIHFRCTFDLMIERIPEKNQTCARLKDAQKRLMM